VTIRLSKSISFQTSSYWFAFRSPTFRAKSNSQMRCANFSAKAVRNLVSSSGRRNRMRPFSLYLRAHAFSFPWRPCTLSTSRLSLFPFRRDHADCRV
jgi:hypothetical protein